MTRFLFLTLAALATSPALFGVDFGAGLEETTAVKTDEITQTTVVRPWLRWAGEGAEFNLKANLTDTVTVDRTNGNATTNTVAGDIDVLSYLQSFTLGPVSGTATFGRMNVSDFDGTLLTSPLDGAQARVSLAEVDFNAVVGTTAFLFKTGTTVAVSADDFLDRGTTADVTKPSTLFAPPRLVAYADAAFPKLVDHQTFRVAAAGQLDLRTDSATDGSAIGSTTHAAPVSVGYLGLGGEGLVTGPLYWSVAGWAGVGTSLTSVSGSTTTWKSSLILNGWGTAGLTLVQPSWSYSVAGLSVQAGSGDSDGLTPSTNTADGTTPTRYTGWFGISRSPTSPVFDKQPGDLITAKAYWSLKPLAGTKGPGESLQLVASLLGFARTTTATYRGAEGDLSLLWRPAADWGASATLGSFLPSSSETDQDIQYLAQLGLNVSL